MTFPSTTDLAGDYRVGPLVHESHRTAVRRGTRVRDDAPVLLKILHGEDVTAAQIAALHHELELLEAFDSPHVGRAHELIRVGGRPALVLEDTGGRSLAKLLAEREPDLAEGLRIARGITAALVVVHGQGVLHNDVNPSNLVVAEAEGRVLLIDFDLASRRQRGGPAPDAEGRAVGTLAYIAPESTGRLARYPDERSDLYSLGVTLYELFTGRRPFTASDPQELVHAHIARRPRSPARARPGLPPTLSTLIATLLEKDPDARYQTAAGVLADLDRCLEAVETTGTIDAFPLRERDQSRSFHLRERLYDRAAELARLQEAFERVAEGPSEAIVLRGPSGIGKASLVRELKHVVAERRGFFIEGDFDSDHAGRPYTGLADAFESLVAQILKRPAEHIARWREHLAASLGDEARVLVDMLPNLAHVLGETPEVPELPAAEAQARFTRRFRELVDSITRRGAVLVVYLDDLQWADEATLDAVKERVLDTSIRRVLLVATIRSGVDSARVEAMLDALDQRGARPAEITLGPIDAEAVAELLADAMSLRPDERADEVAELARLVHARTGGSPFFVRHFVQELERQRQLYFHPETEAWTWSLPDIAARGFTDNVIDLMSGRLAELPAETRQVLRRAALVGNPFDLSAVAGSLAIGRGDVNPQEALGATLKALKPALEAGHVEAASVTFEHADVAMARADTKVCRTLYGELKFRFPHARVQEAAAALLDEDEARQAHREIGRFLLSEETAHGDLADGIHVVLRHLNAATGLEEDEDERYELARLNKLGADKAEATAAFEAALEYRRQAVAVLPEDAWRLERRLTFEIGAGLVESLRVTGRFEAAKEHATALLKRARTRTEKTRVLRSMMQTLLHLRDGEGVDRAVRRAMALFDIPVPEDEAELREELDAVVARITRWEGRHTPRELLDLELMDDPEQRLLMQVLMDATGSSWLQSETLQRYFAMLMVDISIEYGLAPETAFAVAQLSKERADLEDPDQIAHQLLGVSIELAERLANRATFARAISHAVFAAGPALGLRERAELLRRGSDAAYESGQGQFVGFFCYMQLQAHLVLGDPVDVLAEATERSRLRVRGFGMQLLGQEFLGFAEYVDALRGVAPEDNVYLGDEAARERKLGPKPDRQSPGWYALTTARVLVFCRGIGPEAWEQVRLAGSIFRGGTPGMIVGEQCLLEGLIGAEMVRRAATDEERAELRGHVEACLKILRGYRKLSPESYGLCVDLVEAEVAATRGETLRAMELYHQAIDAAEREERHDMLGLGQELAGRFYLGIGQPRIAGPFLSSARRTHRAWGATVVADRIDHEFGALLAPLRGGLSSRGLTTSSSRVSSSSGTTSLDGRAVLEAAQALSGEVDLDRLLVRLVQIIVATAGADRALLVTRSDAGDEDDHGEEWLVRAERRIDESGDGALIETALGDFEELPRSIVDYVLRTGSVVRLDDATTADTYGDDPYVASVQPRSVLCLPALHQGELVALLYLENRLAPGAFSESHLESLSVLAAQAATAIVNAHLYRDLRAARDRLMQSNERLTEYNRALEEDVAARFSARHVVGESVAMRTLLQDVARISASDTPVLLRGEPGTGKEHIARVIHEQSRRADHAFVKVTCRPPVSDPDGPTRTIAIGSPQHLLARFDLAAGGTLYLEDIDALSAEAQAALVERLAATAGDASSVRVLASTSVDLAATVSSGRFSDDLYFRINAFPIRIPALRERPDDIPALVERFVAELAKSLGKRLDGVTDETMAQLAAYRWPGNITELRNVLERAAMMAETPTLHLTDGFGAAIDAGSTLGSYDLVERIGAGGMGEVWKATHQLLRRPAAIKLIPAEALTRGSDVPRTTMRRFEREAQITAQLRSPHTVELYDFGVSDAGTFYYVMELLDGVDLQTLVDRFGAIPAERAVQILLQACKSLSEAHSAGLVHRDIKAANIYLCRLGDEVDFVKVLDFGLVKQADDSGESMTRLTAAGTVTGTPAYMAPEQASEVGDLTAQVDIYALGCIAFWLLTGTIVFEASSAARMLMKHMTEAPPRPSELSELPIPPALEDLVLQCLEKDPLRRPASAALLARGLREIAVDAPWTTERAERWWASHLPRG